MCRCKIFALVAAAALSWHGTGRAVFAQELLSQIQLPNGYLTLDAPRDFGGLSLPGALVQLSPRHGFRYLGHLKDCGLPEKVLQPIPGILGLPASVQHALKVDASIGAKFLALFGLGLSGNDTKQVEVTFINGTDEMLVPLGVVAAAKSNGFALREKCGDTLGLPNVYWVNDAIKVSEIHVRLINSSGAQIEASADKLASTVTGIKAQASASLSDDSQIVIKSPVYIGFRDAPPAELLLGQIRPFSVDKDSKPSPPINFGDSVYGAP